MLTTSVRSTEEHNSTKCVIRFHTQLLKRKNNHIKQYFQTEDNIMTLHITYHDGSNPFVMLNTTKEKIIKEFNYQNKANNHRLTLGANIQIWKDISHKDYILTSGSGNFIVVNTDKYGLQHFSKEYFRLGNALRALINN